MASRSFSKRGAFALSLGRACSFAWPLLLAPGLHAATYFVSNAGVDTNPGTQAEPWRTLARATTSLAAGDSLLLARGSRWVEPLLISTSGTASAPIAIADFGNGDLPTIDGGGTATSACKLLVVRYVALKHLRCTHAVEGLELFNSSDISVDQSTFDGNADRNVMIGGPLASHLAFTGNSIHDARNDCWIDFAPGDNILFENNDVARCVTTTTPFGAGVRVVSDGASEAHRQTNVRILGNHIHDHGAGSGGAANNTGNCLHLDTVGGGLVVADNVFSNCGGNGLELEWAGGSGTHVVERNTASGNGAAGFLLYRRSQGVQVISNTAFGNGINFESLSEFGVRDPVGMTNNLWQGNFAYAPRPGGLNVSFQGGAANDGVNGSGNQYRGNCWGDDGAARFRWGSATAATAAEFVAASAGAADNVCSSSQRRQMSRFE